MAGSARLRGRRRWVALGAAVLLAHLLAIDWFGAQLQPIGVLPKMAEPMFTRLLRQQAPAPQVATAASAQVPEVPRPQLRTIAPRTAPKPAAAASQAARRAASAPKPARAASVPTREPAASAAAAGASAAASTAHAVASAPEPANSAPARPASRPASAGAAARTASAPRAVASASSAAASAPAVGASAPAIGLAPDGWPTDTRVNYRLGGNYRGRLYGSAHVQWLRQGARYETRIDIDITLLASLTLTSQGVVTPQGLKPEVYEELRASGVRRDTLGDDLILLGNGQLVPRPAGVQDTASQFVELGHRFASGQDALAVGRSVRMWLARPGGVDQWTYDIVGRDILQTPELGAVEAYHLIPRIIDKPRGDITAEIWYAPSLQYLPVRIRVNMGQDTYVDLVVENIQQR